MPTERYLSPFQRNGVATQHSTWLTHQGFATRSLFLHRHRSLSYASLGNAVGRHFGVSCFLPTPMSTVV